MVENEKLQKAIEATMAAGYQLNSEAFEFLSQNSGTTDPLEIMNMALQRLQTMQEKPFFIDKVFLEALMQSTTAPIIETPLQEQNNVEEPAQSPSIEQTSGLDTAFYPYAKDMKSEINIIEDVTGKLSSNGTLEEYLEYFQDRFKRIERLLSKESTLKLQHPSLKHSNHQQKQNLKSSAWLPKKEIQKTKRYFQLKTCREAQPFLSLTELQEEVRKKALLLLPDQVVCLAVIKTRTNLFLAEDIIFPEIGRKQQQRAQEQVYAVLTSDLHIGSNKFEKEAFKRFILWLRGKYGTEEMREIASRVKYLLIAGDIVDGVGVYPGQAKELSIRDVHKQYAFAAKYIEKIPSYIEIVICPGNHDAARKAIPQPAISEDYLKGIQGKSNIHSVGSPCLLSLHGVEILMYHGVSLNDIIGVVPGMDNDHPEKAMKLLMQGRHLAPVYGGKTMLSPENRDYLVVEKVPDIFHSGHIHVFGYCNYRGMLVVNSGGWQKQTDYMERMGLVPTPGKVPVVNLQTLETTVLSFL